MPAAVVELVSQKRLRRLAERPEASDRLSRKSMAFALRDAQFSHTESRRELVGNHLGREPGNTHLEAAGWKLPIALSWPPFSPHAAIAAHGQLRPASSRYSLLIASSPLADASRTFCLSRLSAAPCGAGNWCQRLDRLCLHQWRFGRPCGGVVLETRHQMESARPRSGDRSAQASRSPTELKGEKHLRERREATRQPLYGPLIWRRSQTRPATDVYCRDRSAASGH